MARTSTAPLKTARWAAVRSFVAHRASFRCEQPDCSVYLGMTGDVDHIVPRSVCEDVGIGIYDPTNLQYLCPSCHSQKTNAERHAGKEKRPRKTGRTAIQGRDDFLNAAGIDPNPANHEEHHAP
ncbi:HNH endonuclease signature motif containing protein [uncultured Tateyamaria sp.]|uniref:HNH endonuclease n=1 Tax=uncultured Tateyamaria sp. TaxID=455651 RepID=UPI00261B9E0F|nr:HNH endonuclease signature motif containing protein [uncultured Tateyamaria sp.]